MQISDDEFKQLRTQLEQTTKHVNKELAERVENFIQTPLGPSGRLTKLNVKQYQIMLSDLSETLFIEIYVNCFEKYNLIAEITPFYSSALNLLRNLASRPLNGVDVGLTEKEIMSKQAQNIITRG